MTDQISPVITAYISSLKHHLERIGTTFIVHILEKGLLLRGEHFAISAIHHGTAIMTFVQVECGETPALGKLTDCPIGLPKMLAGRPITSSRVELSDPEDIPLAIHAAHAAAIQIETTGQWSGRHNNAGTPKSGNNGRRVIDDMAYQAFVDFREDEENSAILVSRHLTGTQILRIDDHDNCGRMIRIVFRGNLHHMDAAETARRLAMVYYQQCPIAVCSWDNVDDQVEISLALPLDQMTDPGFGTFAMQAIAGAITVYEHDPMIKALLNLEEGHREAPLPAN